jgi:hypothetical protein
MIGDLDITDGREKRQLTRSHSKNWRDALVN